MEFVPGRTAYTYNGNWKLQLDNGIDAYHLTSTHISFHANSGQAARRVYAAARGAAPIVTMLLDAGVDPNARYRADLTALMWAAGHPDNTRADAALQTVELLLTRGAKVDLVDDRGRDALMIAAGLGHAAIAKALLDAGADRRLRDKTGKSAIDLATAPEVKAVIAGP